MLYKLNFKIKSTICLHKHLRTARLKRKTNQENEKTNKQHKKKLKK